MQQKMGALNDQKNTIDEAIEDNAAGIESSKKDIIDIQKDLEIFTSTRNTEKRHHEQELRELQQKLAKLKEETNPLPNKIDNLENEILRKQNEIADIEAALIQGQAESNAAIKKSQLKLDQLEREQASLTKEKGKITAKIDSLESEQAVEDKKAQKMQKWQTNVNRQAAKLDARADNAHDTANAYGAAAMGCILLTVLTGGALAPVLIPAAIGFAGAACVEKKKEHDINKKISAHNEEVDRYLLTPPK